MNLGDTPSCCDAAKETTTVRWHEFVDDDGDVYKGWGVLAGHYEDREPRYKDASYCPFCGAALPTPTTTPPVTPSGATCPHPETEPR